MQHVPTLTLQATVRVSSDGDVILHNEGKRPVYLGGKALVTGKSAKLQHQQVLEVDYVHKK